MIASITGIGWVTSTSMGCGKDFINQKDKFFEMTPGLLPKIKRKNIFDTPDKHFGRMDTFSKTGLAAIAFALHDAGLNEQEMNTTGIVASTVYGCLKTDVDYYHTVLPKNGTMASPGLFAYTLPNCFLGEAAIRFKLKGTSFIINERSSSGMSALRTALENISFGEADKMISGICDIIPPSNFPVNKDTFPGALFFVIEKLPTEKSLHYGRLKIKKDGTLLYNQNKIKNLISLAKECMFHEVVL